MNNWKKTTLREITEKVVDNRGKTPPIVGSGYEILEVNAISQDKREPDYSKVTKFVDEDTYNSWFRNGHVKKNDILIPTVGTIGNVSFSKQNRGSIAQNLIALRIKEGYDPLFSYYKLKSPKFKRQILNLDIGGVQPSVKVPHLLAQEILLPSLDEQKQIASVLSSLDDKIELLRAQNETLEKIAQGIFKEWFVNFRIDGKKLKLENGIPEGWRVGKIYETGKVVCGKTPSKENADYFGGKIPFIKIPDMHGQMFILNTNDKLSKNGADSQKTKTIPKNSICVSCIATVGLVSIATEDSQTNQQINSVIPNNENLVEFLFFTLRAMSESLNSIGSSGTTTANVNTGTFMNLEILIPTEEPLLLFHETSSPIFSKIKANNYQIRTLSRLRDMLLPKLMSGEVTIKEL